MVKLREEALKLSNRQLTTVPQTSQLYPYRDFIPTLSLQRLWGNARTLQYVLLFSFVLSCVKHIRQRWKISSPVKGLLTRL